MPEASPWRLQPHAALLAFDDDAADLHNLSGAACGDGVLWLVGDEHSRIDRLVPMDGGATPRWGRRRPFALAGLIDLPGAQGDECDLEGLALHEGWLWLVGSHSLKRGKPVGAGDHAADARALADVRLDGNRLLLARIPLEVGDDGLSTPVRKARDGRRSAWLQGGRRHNALTRLLREDPHLGPFMALPGKDNGLDIEGVAVDGERLWLGLRGPVLRGWSAVLGLRLRAKGRRLKLVAPQEGGAPLAKHFLDLDGLGIRDLHLQGDELFLLAGPTMALDGEVRLYRWAHARRALHDAPPDGVRFECGVAAVAALPHGPGSDRAEAFCALEGAPGRWLVVYDAPGPARRAQAGAVWADIVASAVRPPKPAKMRG